MKIYVASSWRNAYQPDVVRFLRSLGYDVYDFRHPDDDGVPGGFQWSQIPNWQPWPPSAFRECLKEPIAAKGHDRDMEALRDADACVLVLPCNRSAHTEFGFHLGRIECGYREWKSAIVYYPPGVEPQEPELMYRNAQICCDEAELATALESAETEFSSVIP